MLFSMFSMVSVLCSLRRAEQRREGWMCSALHSSAQLSSAGAVDRRDIREAVGLLGIGGDDRNDRNEYLL